MAAVAKVVSFPLENRVSAVITISEFNESPEQAIQSVLENPQFFADLHLVKFGYSSHEVLYLGWEKDLEALGGLGLEPVWHAKLDPSKLKTRAILRLEPDLRVTDGAVKTMLDDMLYYTNRDHFGVSSITFIEHDDGFKVTPRVWIEALSYGFLLVILMMDTFRSMINLLQYHRTVDLRADLTITTYPNRTRVARDRWWIWWLFTGISPSRRGGAACMQVPSQKDQGFKFVLRTVKMHSGMGLGLWIFGFLLYWTAFSWPFWNAFISPHTRLGSWLTRDMTALYWIIPYMLHTALVGYVSWIYIELPLKMLPVQVILYTFYLTLSPVLFLYGRFHTSRASWEKKIKKK